MKRTKDTEGNDSGEVKMTFFKTKNGKEWMPLERYKAVISPVSERVKAPKGFVRITEWTQTFVPSECNYDFTEDMKSGYLTFQGKMGYFPPSNFITPEPPKNEDAQ